MKQMIAIYNIVDHVFLVVKGAISSLVCQARQIMQRNKI
jgi:hypothetical protein